MRIGKHFELVVPLGFMLCLLSVRIYEMPWTLDGKSPPPSMVDEFMDELGFRFRQASLYETFLGGNYELESFVKSWEALEGEGRAMTRPAQEEWERVRDSLHRCRQFEFVRRKCESLRDAGEPASRVTILLHDMCGHGVGLGYRYSYRRPWHERWRETDCAALWVDVGEQMNWSGELTARGLVEWVDDVEAVHPSISPLLRQRIANIRVSR